MTQQRLQGQRVLVAGAAGGIGSAVVRSCVAEGARVFAAGRDHAKLATLAEPLDAEVILLDVHDNSAVESFFSGQELFDHVVVAAASNIAGSVAGLSVADAQTAMDIKFWGAYRIAKAARISPSGSLTFVSGMVSTRPSATSVVQGSINAALEALARGLALEIAPVRVNTVSPGLIDTPLHDRLAEDAKQALFKRMADVLPVGRIGAPDDVAQAILFVMTNRFITGATINVDGGGRIV